MDDAVVLPEHDDDELEVEELDDVYGGVVAPLDDINSQCTVNGNCGCSA